jgi:hypothetical protein
MTTSRKTLFLGLLAIVFNLYIYRTVFSGNLIGEPFDARLMITLHEHMWRWLNGLVSFRDTEFFYPYNTGLGFSDVFLVQGILYSVFRLLGFDSLSSWINITLLLVIVGNLGWVAIARKFLDKFIIQILFVLTMISSLSFVNYFTFNANIVGYTYLSWLVLFLINIKDEKKSNKRHIKISLFIIALLIYALSCWYGTFFLLLTFFSYSIIFVIKKRFKLNFKYKIDKKVVSIYLFFSPLILFLIWLFYYVYISIALQPQRSIDELIRNSPRIQQIFKGAHPKLRDIDGAIFSKVYEFLDLDKIIIYGNELGDWGGGLGLILPLATIFVIILSFFKRKLIKDYSWILAIIISYCYLVVFGKDYSIHSYFFEIVPGVNSIRSPSRYIILVGFAAIFTTYFVLNKIYTSSKNTRIKSILLVLLLTLLLDQIRAPFKGWERSEFINSELISMESEIQRNCDYFYYDRPGGWWFDQIEALSFAVQIGVPTVNGYSGAYPPGYPIEPWNSIEDPLRIFDWIDKIDKNKRGCFVTGRSKIRYLNRKTDSIDFVGFTGNETKGQNSWRWAISPSPYVYIIDHSFSIKEIKFNLKTSQCFSSQKISITDSQNKMISPVSVVSGEKEYVLNIDMTDSIVKMIQFSTDAEACFVDGDPRNLYFEIKNFKMN